MCAVNSPRLPIDEVDKGERVTPQLPIDPDTHVVQRGVGRARSMLNGGVRATVQSGLEGRVIDVHDNAAAPSSVAPR